MRAAVQAKLEPEWSPEQIAGWLRATFPLVVAWHLCHETTYQALYHGGHGGLSRTLTTRLCTGRPLRKRRRRPDRRRVRFRLIALPDGHSPDRLCAAITPILGSLPAEARRTLTWDQGSETARHDRIAPFFTEAIFLAHPATTAPR